MGKCYFVEGKQCPVPKSQLDGNYCRACAEWANIFIDSRMLELQEEEIEIIKEKQAKIFTPSKTRPEVA